MSLNERQRNFLTQVKEACKLGVQLAKAAPEIKEAWDEEFASSQDNDISTEETTLNAEGLTTAAIQTAINQFITYYDRFWTNQSVVTREYGKDCRRVAGLE